MTEKAPNLAEVEALAKKYDERVEMHSRLTAGPRGLPTTNRGEDTAKTHSETARVLRALAAERDALAAEVERLREALVPFVQHLRERPVSDTNAKFVLAPWHMGDGGWLAAMDFCKARAALEGRDG